ncbi:MAG: universal stress protein [Myxococcota bacterium]
MSEATPAPLVHSVFHLTDFSPSCDVAFAHALAIALVRRSSLTLLHAGEADLDTDWRRFPAVRATLERWGLLEPGSDRSAVFEQFAVSVKKVNLGTARPVSTVLDYLTGEPSDLIVVAYDAQKGITGVARDSVAEDVARRSGAMTLFVPSGASGFVSARDGSLSLRRILVPIAEEPAPVLAVEASRRVARGLGDPPVDVTMLNIGDGNAPVIALPDEDEGTLRYRQVQRGGDVVDGILAAADEFDADLVAMVTNGRSSLSEIVRGSHTERVVRRARCPVLSLPEAWSQRV